MGCFNVACGVSRLSINYGDKCVLIPLTVSYKNKYNQIPLSPSIIGYDEMFVPFCFPIKGTYDDYGSIENIEKDENTKAIEDYFGFSIEDFVELVTDGRYDVYDTFSKFCTMFYGNIDNLGYNYDVATFLTELGFNRKKSSYLLDKKCNIVLGEKEFSVTFIPQEKTISYRNGSKRDFLRDYYKFFKEYIGVSKENIEKLKIFSQMSGMFVLRDVYDFYALNRTKENTYENTKLTPTFVQDLGFQFNNKTKCYELDDIEISFEEWSPKISNLGKEYGYGYVEDLFELFKKKKLTFDLSKYDGMDVFDFRGDNFIRQFPLRLKNIKKLNKKLIDCLEKDDKLKKDFENLSEYFESYKDILYIRKEDLFQDFYIMYYNHNLYSIYIKSFVNGENFNQLIEFSRFIDAMQISNVLLFPTFCGTQSGCRQAEEKLNYITNKIIEDRKIKLKEDVGDEFEQINPLIGFNDAFY